MDKRRLKASAAPDLLPWQSVVMVACVTAAGLLHQHPHAVQPLLAAVQTAGLQGVHLRSSAVFAHHTADLLNASLWLLH